MLLHTVDATLTPALFPSERPFAPLSDPGNAPYLSSQRHLTPSVTSRSDVPLFFHFFFPLLYLFLLFFFFFGVLFVAFLVTWPTEMTLSMKG